MVQHQSRQPARLLENLLSAYPGFGLSELFQCPSGAGRQRWLSKSFAAKDTKGTPELWELTTHAAETLLLSPMISLPPVRHHHCQMFLTFCTVSDCFVRASSVGAEARGLFFKILDLTILRFAWHAGVISLSRRRRWKIQSLTHRLAIHCRLDTVKA